MKNSILVLIFLMIFTLTACGGSDVEEPTIEEDTMQTYDQYLSDTNPVVTITVKDYGVMTLQLFPEVAPKSVDNFIHYVLDEAYTDSTFHRVIERFMIQGGQVSQTACPIPGEFASNGFENELKHTRGVLSFARTMVNDSATSQFFIMHQNSPHLDGEYAAFGALIEGFNILDNIATSATGSNDQPRETIQIESITIELNGYEPSERVCAS